ncbi:MAG: diacylglycerol/lipid kinase family protein [Oscillospiraceae bacterium]
MTIVLYNPLSGNGTGRANAEKLNSIISDSIEFRDIRGVDFKEFFEVTPADTKVIICGGDGTINRFVNSYEGEFPYEREVYYYPAGLGNDFVTDIGDNGVILLNPYIEQLPVVCVNGKEYKVLNGVGFGIDGYCCEEGDRLHAISKKKVNYTSIAIKGLLFKYKPVNAVVNVDGQEYTFRKVWLAPTMNGRYYGGGMCIAPNQDRLNAERTVSCVVMHGSGKLKTLMVFPSIFKGEHIRHTDIVKVLTGHEIEVTFDRPTALQIDGETISGVTHYSIKNKVLQN